MSNGDMKFILAPMTDILSDAAQAMACASNEFDILPMSEYIMQSVFLRMTGFQEQKLKAIQWYLADIDYGRKDEVMAHGFSKCSSYDDKNKIYKDLYETVKDAHKGMKIDKTATLIADVIDTTKDILIDSGMCYLDEKQWRAFDAEAHLLITDKSIARQNRLLNSGGKSKDGVEKEYAKLYCYRNWCAHNVFAHRKFVPELDSLADGNVGARYFVWFALLSVIDAVFTQLFMAVAYPKRGNKLLSWE